MRWMVAAAALAASGPAHAACECACVNGQQEALCSSTLDIKPICPPRICPIVPPSIRPIETPGIPPIGTTRCRLEQVSTGYGYAWQRVCE